MNNGQQSGLPGTGTNITVTEVDISEVSEHIREMISQATPQNHSSHDDECTKVRAAVREKTAMPGEGEPYLSELEADDLSDILIVFLMNYRAQRGVQLDAEDHEALSMVLARLVIRELQNGGVDGFSEHVLNMSSKLAILASEMKHNITRGLFPTPF